MYEVYERLVWIDDGATLYLSCVWPWHLEPDGTVRIDGRVLHWYEAKEFR
jgi:hypothetical protein